MARMASHKRANQISDDAEAVALVEAHWAVRAIESIVRARAVAAAERWWAQPPERAPVVDHTLVAAVSTLATAYDLAGLEHLDGLTRAPALATEGVHASLRVAAARAYFFHAVLTPSADDAGSESVFRLLHLAALAVVAGRGDDIPGRKQKREIDVKAERTRASTGAGVADKEAADFERLLLDRTALVWLELLSPRRDAGALDRVRELIAIAREQRSADEVALPGGGDAGDVTARRFRLFALYHLVDAAAVLSTYLARGEPTDVLTLLGRHFLMARAAVVGDPRHEISFAWLHGAAFVLAERRTEQLSLPGLAREQS
jgi:hypothetical protein